MDDEKITPIRPDLAPKPLVTTNPTRETIEERAEEIRELIFQAMAIVDVLASAARSEMMADPLSTQSTLKTVEKLLDAAAGRLEPGAITQEVSHG
jgi:hypothetical protein